jgi:ATP-dependent helicase/nuclease subunit B
VKRKGEEIKRLLQEFEKILETERLVDDAELLRRATQRLERDPGTLPKETLVLVPEDLAEDLRRLEIAFLEGIPGEQKIALPVDPPAPPAVAGIFRSLGEVNEVREVLRSCLERGLPFDEVEILHTDAATYVPLIYEIASGLSEDDNGDSLPATFAEGVPARYGRPARALLGWLSWMHEDYPQATLVRMMQEGLLRIRQAEEEGLSFAELGGRFRMVTIGSGRARYVTKIDEAIDAVERRIASGRPSDEEDQDASDERVRLGRRSEGLKAIRHCVDQLLSHTPEKTVRQKDLLHAAQTFLDGYTRHTNRFDEFVRKKLSDEIRALAEWIGEEDVEGLDIRKWLEDACLASPVRGERPQPGRFHVASVQSGGHSGRSHTFILGLDDSRFPGAGLQDPILLDGERRRVSRDLPTAGSRLERTVRGFARLLARLRGTVTLSYCCRSLADDREMFPSPVVLQAYRALAADPEGDQDDLIGWLPESASFAPGRLDRCLDLTESWIWWMCEGDGILDPEAVIVRSFPHLGRGFVAREARASDTFTEFDGYVPEAGLDLDPTRTDGPILSASALELAGTCPMEYFFRYVLGIRLPDEIRIDPRVWLDPAEKGQLLHAVFRKFMHLLGEQHLLPDFQRDEPFLMQVLEEEIAWWRDNKPIPSRVAYEREAMDLRLAARIFLQEEEGFCRESKPFCFEASVGLLPEGQGTPLDVPDPVPVKLGGGKTLRARGRIDRIDQVPDAGGNRYTVWDYKTGSSWRYRRDGAGSLEDPFNGGRLVQGALYMQMAERRLKEAVSPDAVVDRFGYFFPTTREHGERVDWTASELSDGPRVLGRLCETLARGAFPFTDDPGDVSYSDYKEVFWDRDAAAEASSRKLENRKNRPLEAFRRLRGYDEE